MNRIVATSMMHHCAGPVIHIKHILASTNRDKIISVTVFFPVHYN